jgi:hypothetical protein
MSKFGNGNKKNPLSSKIFFTNKKVEKEDNIVSQN